MLAEQHPHSEPVYVVNALESAWNEHDFAALSDLFDEESVITLEPALAKAAVESRFEGLSAIGDLLRQYVPGGSFAVRGLAAEGHTATWEFELSSDRVRSLGLSGAAGRAQARVRNGRIQELVLSFSPETTAQLRAVRGQSLR